MTTATSEMRRGIKTGARTAPDTLAPLGRNCSQIGMTMWFDTIVDRAIAATITIDVAELKPPRKDSIASPLSSSASGTVKTKRSGFDPSGMMSSPTTAMGTTKRLMRFQSQNL